MSTLTPAPLDNNITLAPAVITLEPAVTTPIISELNESGITFSIIISSVLGFFILLLLLLHYIKK
jgi:hypothetical protein